MYTNKARALTVRTFTKLGKFLGLPEILKSQCSSLITKKKNEDVSNKARALTIQNFCLPRMNPRRPHVGEASKMTGRKPTLPMTYLGFMV